MKAIHLYLAQALCGLALLTAACVNTDIIETDSHEGNGQEITLTALLPDEDPDTKLSITDDETQRALKVEWNQTGSQLDRFRIINNNGIAFFTQSGIGESTFTGTLPTPVISNRMTTYYASYPASASVAFNGNTPAVQYQLQKQSGKLDMGSLCFMKGILSFGIRNGVDLPSQINGDAVKFSHLTAVLKPTFNKMSKDIDKILIEIEGVNTNGWFDLKDGTAYGGDTNIIEIKYSTSDAVGNDRYIFLPPLPTGTDIKFTVCTADGGIFKGTITSKKDILPGYLYTASVNMVRTSSRKWSNGMQPSSSVPGEGTESNPYQIRDAYDLQWFLNQSITAGKYYKLVNDLIISSEGSGIYDQWEPRKVFEGTFDGNGNKISGDMLVKPNSSETQYVGFIGQNIGTIKNLVIDAYTGIENGQDDCYVPYVGGIAGSNKGTIYNCTVKGTVVAPFAVYGCNLGGIAGFNFGGIIEDCYNYAAIYGTEYAKTDIPAYVGGITGGNTISGTKSGYIKGCINRGRVDGCINPTGGTCYAGGIAGKNFSSCYIINSCVNYGSVSIIGRGTNYYGGLAGYNDGNVCTCCIDQSTTGVIIGGGKAQSYITTNDCEKH